MNNRTEAKLTDLSGMQKAIEEILKQAWERGRKYGQNEARPKGRMIIKQPSGWAYCSECGKVLEPQDKFCWNCGADMRKGEEEE